MVPATFARSVGPPGSNGAPQSLKKLLPPSLCLCASQRQMCNQRTAHSMPNQKPKLPELFYHLKTGTYYMRLEAARRFIPLDGRTCKLEMMKRGFYIDTEIKDTGLKAGDNELLTAQLENYVDYAGPLAGYPIGMFATSGGKRVLVTSETRPIEPKKGRLEWINRFIDNLLSNSDGQVEYLLLWLKFALESISDGAFRPLPMLVLAGEAGCGKSFLQLIITELVGGRSAK